MCLQSEVVGPKCGGTFLHSQHLGAGARTVSTHHPSQMVCGSNKQTRRYHPTPRYTLKPEWYLWFWGLTLQLLMLSMCPARLPAQSLVSKTRFDFCICKAVFFSLCF